MIIKDLLAKTPTEFYYKLPIGCRGIDQMMMLRDQNLVAFLSEGYFYIVDISKSGEDKIEVKINIRIPGE